MKYEFIDAHRSEFTMIRMCKALKVFESRFYRWKSKGRNARDMEDEILVPKIRAIHEESKFTYRPSRIKTALEKMGVINPSISRIRRLMRENGIYSITRYKHKPYVKEKIETRYNENIINREFSAEAPDKAWCGDITYIKTSTGWVYLAAVIDLNREVVGYSLSKKANTELAKRAMANALVNRKPAGGLVFHSDRGCQYSSKGYLEYLEEHHVESSMSCKGNPYDNACTESFFATLKKEWVYHKVYKDLEQLDGSLFEYIELFYNRKRMHTSIDNMTPREYYLNYMVRKLV